MSLGEKYRIDQLPGMVDDASQVTRFSAMAYGWMSQETGIENIDEARKLPGGGVGGGRVLAGRMISQ